MQGRGAPCPPPTYLVEVGVPRGRQLEALLTALVQQDAAQQLVGRPHVVAEERGCVLRGISQCPGQPQGPLPIHLRLVPAQLLVLGQGASAMSAPGPSRDTGPVAFQWKPPSQGRSLKNPQTPRWPWHTQKEGVSGSKTPGERAQVEEDQGRDPESADPDAGRGLEREEETAAQGPQQPCGPGPRPAWDHAIPRAWTPSARPHPRAQPTMALRSMKETVVQLKSSGGSQPFSPLQCRTAFPREQGRTRRAQKLTCEPTPGWPRARGCRSHEANTALPSGLGPRPHLPNIHNLTIDLGCSVTLRVGS